MSASRRVAQSRRRTCASALRATTSKAISVARTFRLTLPSLLFERMAWLPVMTDRPLLTREDNRALTEWQHEHLRLTWATHPEPWAIEHEVIAKLQPPLHLAGNRAHPLAATISAARRRFKDHASAQD